MTDFKDFGNSITVKPRSILQARRDVVGYAVRRVRKASQVFLTRQAMCAQRPLADHPSGKSVLEVVEMRPRKPTVFSSDVLRLQTRKLPHATACIKLADLTIVEQSYSQASTVSPADDDFDKDSIAGLYVLCARSQTKSKI